MKLIITLMMIIIMPMIIVMKLIITLVLIIIMTMIIVMKMIVNLMMNIIMTMIIVIKMIITLMLIIIMTMNIVMKMIITLMMIIIIALIIHYDKDHNHYAYHNHDIVDVLNSDADDDDVLYNVSLRVQAAVLLRSVQDHGVTPLLAHFLPLPVQCTVIQQG